MLAPNTKLSYLLLIAEGGLLSALWDSEAVQQIIPVKGY